MITQYTSSTQISKNFNSDEFKCPCCGKCGVDSEINNILESVFTKMKAHKIIITSGYRCNKYEMTLQGGVANGYHTKYKAVDINVWKDSKTRYSSREICLALEDLGWNHGIGIISDTAVHIDSRDKKYWFDERNNCKSIGDSFYNYYMKIDRKRTKERFGFDEELTMKLLDTHPFPASLYDKLANKN